MRLLRLSMMVMAALNATAAWAQSVGEDERQQIGTYRAEEALATTSADPVVDSVLWDRGDLRVRITQAAPCGYDVANPDWAVSGDTIILRYGWFKLDPKAPDAKTLCLQRVQAWVFRVPEQRYRVLLDDWVPRYAKSADGFVIVHR